MDLARRFPIPTDSFHFVFSEHVIEHFDYATGQQILSECYRILAPGGVLRTATPDLMRFIGLFTAHRTEEQDRYLRQKIAVHRWPDTGQSQTVVLNLQEHDFGHRFLYDAATLCEALERAGFRSVYQTQIGVGRSAELCNLETRVQGTFAEINAFETMVLEAVK